MPQPGLALPEQYQQQLQTKISSIKAKFAEFYSSEIEVFESKPSHFRMRAEFKVWKKEGEASFVMFDKEAPKTPIKITNFSIGSEKICELMGGLLPLINSNEILRHKLFQVEFLTSTTGEAVTTLIYHKQLDEAWEKEAKTISDSLNSHIIGRSRKQKVVLGQDFVTEKFTVAGKDYSYQQIETGFTQPNGKLCEKMLNWAHSVCSQKGKDKDLLELYCGNGNFTLPLSTNFRKVLATEVSKTSVRSALYNIDLNGVKNIEIARMSSEEFTEALNGTREFYRLREIDLKSYEFSTLFVDPPRSGLDDETEKLASRFDNIIYVSCNPETLYKNMRALSQTHRITSFAVFDQFPYTDHLECGVYLEKR